MPFDTGNTLKEAFNLGNFSGSQTTRRTESIGTWIPNVATDSDDYYRFTVSSSSFVSTTLNGLTDNAGLKLLNADGSVRKASNNIGATAETITDTLPTGTYYIQVYAGIRVTPTFGIANTAYTLSMQSSGSRLIDSNLLEVPNDLGTYDGRTTTVSQAIGGIDTNDYYRIELKEQREVNLQLSGLSADASLELSNSANQIVAKSYQASTALESIRATLEPGIYTARVFSFDGMATNYSLTLSDKPISFLNQLLNPPTLVKAGTLGADYFSLAPGYQRYVFSGNGNVEYGSQSFDCLDLSSLASSSVTWNPVKPNGSGGVRYNPGNGDRLFDQLRLSDGREILLEGIEQIIFSDRPTSFSERLLEVSINQNLTVNPTDPLFSQQWNLHMTGVHTAWRFTTGSDQVLIGIQDSGLGLASTGGIHDDLRPGNANVNYSAEPGVFFGHGTAVQGIIAAKTNNPDGMSGINWNSGVYPIDVFDGTAPLPRDSSLNEAIQEMIGIARPLRKRLVINMSLVSTEPIEEVVKNNQDVLFVIAAGNDGQLGIGINAPANLAIKYANVIAVGASWGKNDSSGRSQTPGTRISYSQYGTGLTLMAPSEHLTTRAIINQTTGTADFDYHPNIQRSPTDLPFDGTSAAAPNVTGIASLVWSANSKLTAAQVRQILSETAIDIGTPGYDIFTGHGLVNADTAVRRALALVIAA